MRVCVRHEGFIFWHEGSLQSVKGFGASGVEVKQLIETAKICG